MNSAKTADITLLIVAALAVFLLAVIFYAGAHGPTRQSVVIDDCALVLTRSGHECR